MADSLDLEAIRARCEKWGRWDYEDTMQARLDVERLLAEVDRLRSVGQVAP